jgi:phage shock protein A
MSNDEQISEYERFVNQVAADTEVVKVVLSAMIVKMALARGTEVVEDLEEVTKLALQKGATEAATTPLSNRLHQLKLSRTDDYFRDIRNVIRLASSGPSRTKGN